MTKLDAAAPDSSPSSRGRFVRQALVVEAALGLIAIAIGWLFGAPIIRQFDGSLRAVLIGFAASVPMIAVLFATRLVHRGPIGRLNRAVDRMVTPLFVDCGLGDFAMISLVAGFGEEMLFRGLIQSLLSRWLGAIAGLAIASVVFGLAHSITASYAALATAIGAYLGGIFLWRDELLAPSIAHAVYDFVALVYLTRAVRPKGDVRCSEELTSGTDGLRLPLA